MSTFYPTPVIIEPFFVADCSLVANRLELLSNRSRIFACSFLKNITRDVFGYWQGLLGISNDIVAECIEINVVLAVRVSPIKCLQLSIERVQGTIIFVKYQRSDKVDIIALYNN